MSRFASKFLFFKKVCNSVLMAQTTRTLNPLPFEHLEPKRFEDLIRQLAYDFKQWRMLEATGRSGGDDGYAIRGWEVIPDIDREIDITESEDESSTQNIEAETERKWLFQCKREQKITPKKLEKYLDDIPEEERQDLYGIVFATSSNISKKSRDLFMQKCRGFGIAECHIWSQAEIEDMLFQPKNDNILFAHFGISLKIKQRSIKTQLRSALTTKRKIYSALGHTEKIYQEVLFRDPEDEKYPYIDKDLPRKEHKWKVARVTKHHPRGIIIEQFGATAYLHDDNERWDVADACNKARCPDWKDPWKDEDKEEEYRELERNIFDFTSKNIEEKNRGHFAYSTLLDYRDILDVDKQGDTFFDGPIIFVSFDGHYIPTSGSLAVITVPPVMEHQESGPPKIIADTRNIHNPDREKRIKIFPDELRKKEKKE